MQCLKEDFYYKEETGSLLEIAKSASYCIENFFIYSKNNPILCPFGDKVFFAPDERNIERDGLETAMIKYAVHFITGKNEATGFRNFDKSKASKISNLLLTLQQAEKRIITLNSQSVKTKNYIKNISKNVNSIVVCQIIEPGSENLARVVAFLPNQRDSLITKKIASALEYAEA